MKVQILVLVTSERLIAEVEDRGDRYLVKEPFVIIYRGDEKGNIVGAGLQPFVLGSAGNCEISKHQVITIMDAAESLGKQYASMTSVIQMPSTNQKLLLQEKK